MRVASALSERISPSLACRHYPVSVYIRLDKRRSCIVPQHRYTLCTNYVYTYICIHQHPNSAAFFTIRQEHTISFSRLIAQMKVTNDSTRLYRSMMNNPLEIVKSVVFEKRACGRAVVGGFVASLDSSVTVAKQDNLSAFTEDVDKPQACLTGTPRFGRDPIELVTVSPNNATQQVA